jgi:hypothetical protein
MNAVSAPLPGAQHTLAPAPSHSVSGVLARRRYGLVPLENNAAQHGRLAARQTSTTGTRVLRSLDVGSAFPGVTVVRWELVCCDLGEWCWRVLHFCTCRATCAEDTLAEWLRRRPAKPMGSPRVGSNPTGVVVRYPFLMVQPEW